MERTIGIFGSKSFEFFMRVEFIVERKQKEDDREQIAARDIKRTIGTFGSNSFEFLRESNFIAERRRQRIIGEQIAARDIRRIIGTFGLNRFEFSCDSNFIAERKGDSRTLLGILEENLGVFGSQHDMNTTQTQKISTRPIGATGIA